MKQTNIHYLEAKLKELVQTEKYSPSDLVIAVHNVCCHGALWPTLNFGPKDKYLGEMFTGFELSIAGARKVKAKVHKKKV
jgi:hypothetical protein